MHELVLWVLISALTLAVCALTVKLEVLLRHFFPHEAYTHERVHEIMNWVGAIGGVVELIRKKVAPEIDVSVVPKWKNYGERK